MLREPADDVDMRIWPFDQVIWARIQDAVGQPAKGADGQAWHLINQALVFASMEQQRQSLPPQKEIRAEQQRLLEAIDGLIDLMGITTSLSSTKPFAIDATVFDWLMQGALRKLHPAGPRLSENKRRDGVSVQQSVRLLREHYDTTQDQAQEQVLELLRQMGPSLGLLRELAAMSLAEASVAQRRGAGLDLTRFVFVDHAAAAYEVAYKRLARPGPKDATGRTGPAVRFIKAVVQEARKTDTIEQPYSMLLKPALRMTPNTIHRQLTKRQAGRSPPIR